MCEIQQIFHKGRLQMGPDGDHHQLGRSIAAGSPPCGQVGIGRGAIEPRETLTSLKAGIYTRLQRKARMAGQSPGMGQRLGRRAGLIQRKRKGGVVAAANLAETHKQNPEAGQ